MNVFISHSAADKQFAKRLANALRERQVDVWSATDIRPGDDFAKAISDAISRADAVIPVISRSSAESPAVAAEVALAVANRIDGGQKRIVPVLADRSAEAPFFLRDIQWVDLSDSQKFKENFDKVISGLPRGERTSGDEVDVLKTRGEWLRAQREILEAEKRAIEAARWREFRYITLTLAAASIVAIAGLISFTGLRKLADSFWLPIVAPLISFIVGAFTATVTARAPRRGSGDDE